MLKLKALKLDKFLSRLYVSDEENRVMVIVDRGVFYERTGQVRYQLYECDSRGNLGVSIKDCWELTEGLEGTPFPSGFRHSKNTRRSA